MLVSLLFPFNISMIISSGKGIIAIYASTLFLSSASNAAIDSFGCLFTHETYKFMSPTKVSSYTCMSKATVLITSDGSTQSTINGVLSPIFNSFLTFKMSS